MGFVRIQTRGAHRAFARREAGAERLRREDKTLQRELALGNALPSDRVDFGVACPHMPINSSISGPGKFSVYLDDPFLDAVQNQTDALRMVHNPSPFENDILDRLTVAILNESLRLLQICNRKASPAQISAICTAGQEGTLLQTCLVYVKQEWPGETRVAGFFRDFHAHRRTGRRPRAGDSALQKLWRARDPMRTGKF